MCDFVCVFLYVLYTQVKKKNSKKQFFFDVCVCVCVRVFLNKNTELPAFYNNGNVINNNNNNNIGIDENNHCENIPFKFPLIKPDPAYQHLLPANLLNHNGNDSNNNNSNDNNNKTQQQHQVFVFCVTFLFLC